MNRTQAILVVSFGTSYPETRAKTIEACENKIRDMFPDYDVFRAFTSNKIRKNWRCAMGCISTRRRRRSKIESCRLCQGHYPIPASH